MVDLRLGALRLTDAAPLAVAREMGWFAAAGLAVTVSIEPSWANVADKLAWGGLDGAVMLHPLVIAMALGLRGRPAPLRVIAGLSRGGNAVTLSPAAERERAPLRLAAVHAFSTHDLLLRRFLDRTGRVAAEIAALPPSAMPRALATGRIDGFCAGAPWSAVAAQAGTGITVARSADLWPAHPEKCLAIRADGPATEHADALRAVLAHAGTYCADPANSAAIADLLAQPDWIDLPAALLAETLPGGTGPDIDRSLFGPEAAGITPAEQRAFMDALARRQPLPTDAVARVAALYRPVTRD